MDEEPSISGLLPVPRWLSRAEKADLRRLESQRAAIGKPVSAAEVDAIADLGSARSRIADLRKLYKQGLRQLKENPLINDERAFVLRLANQIDQATGRAQRMARQLGLGPTE